VGAGLKKRCGWGRKKSGRIMRRSRGASHPGLFFKRCLPWKESCDREGKKEEYMSGDVHQKKKRWWGDSASRGEESCEQSKRQGKGAGAWRVETLEIYALITKKDPGRRNVDQSEKKRLSQIAKKEMLSETPNLPPQRKPQYEG